ncbi:MAG: RNHCP domain-containing protein [Eubacterium sp.]|jgi:DNA-directed RNA polymerase subunit RPC12/RpoP|nr:RNHCP domain-containing protein [Eubacterium sp.]
MINKRNFIMLDERFTCLICGAKIEKLGYTARDHCPNCLSSLHVDINPGDRAENCGGILEPIGIELNKKGCQIIYKCKKCGIKKKNIAAKDDNKDLIIELSARPVN